MQRLVCEGRGSKLKDLAARECDGLRVWWDGSGLSVVVCFWLWCDNGASVKWRSVNQEIEEHWVSRCKFLFCLRSRDS